MPALIPADSTWRKSSFSGAGGNGGGCVEVAFLPDGVAIRDTKNRALPPHHYTTPEWNTFLAAIRAGEFNRP
ncbi:MAG: DUF397 domain-containing protein [Pseudonocardia sp.]